VGQKVRLHKQFDSTSRKARKNMTFVIPKQGEIKLTPQHLLSQESVTALIAHQTSAFN
jgi:hypothetical protein